MLSSSCHSYAPRSIIPWGRGVLVRLPAVPHLWPWVNDIFQPPSSCSPHTTKLCVIRGWACQPPLPTLQVPAGTHLGSAGWAPWHHQCEPHHQHCPALVSTSIDWVQPRVVFFLILTNQLIRVQNNILRLGKSFWLWKILKFILVLLAQTTWRLSAKLHKTN